jgi:hypothetical protein
LRHDTLVMTQANSVSNGTILVFADVTLMHDGATFCAWQCNLVPDYTILVSGRATLLPNGATLMHDRACFNLVLTSQF